MDLHLVTLATAKEDLGKGNTSTEAYEDDEIIPGGACAANYLASTGFENWGPKMGAPRRPHKTGKSKGERILERLVEQLEKELLAGRSSGGRRKSSKDNSPDPSDESSSDSDSSTDSFVGWQEGIQEGRFSRRHHHHWSSSSSSTGRRSLSRSKSKSR